MGWDAIAAAVGLRHRSSAIRAAKAYTGSLPEPDRDAMRAASSEVLSMARSVALQAMAAGRAGAIGDVVKVEARLAALHGLDAPTEITVYSPTQGELEAWVAEMSARAMPALVEPDLVDVDSVEVDPALVGDFAAGGGFDYPG